MSKRGATSNFDCAIRHKKKDFYFRILLLLLCVAKLRRKIFGSDECVRKNTRYH